MKPLYVQWGGGNIGRSFMGQLFSSGGYRVLFIDINSELISALNARQSYTVETVSAEGTKRISVHDVSALDVAETEKTERAITSASLMGVSVGKNAWPHIAQSLARYIERRYQERPDEPLDIILAENIREGKEYAASLLKRYLPSSFPFDRYVGIVETSIGKMVPMQDAQDLLTLRAEPYHTLIVDEKGFLGPIPQIEGMQPVSPIEAYVDRKLFIHNLGHAAAAYLGFAADPSARYISDVLDKEEVLTGVRKAMRESADILQVMYSEVFSSQDLDEHITDLISRFHNPYLKDTLHRVGRDLRRKLRYDDRLLGIIIEAEKRHLPWKHIAQVYISALSFLAPDGNGEAYAPDRELLIKLKDSPFTEQLRETSAWSESGLSEELLLEIAKKMKTWPSP